MTITGCLLHKTRGFTAAASGETRFTPGRLKLDVHQDIVKTEERLSVSICFSLLPFVVLVIPFLLSGDVFQCQNRSRNQMPSILVMNNWLLYYDFQRILLLQRQVIKISTLSGSVEILYLKEEICVFLYILSPRILIL